jgi:hypothetical protein
MPAIAAAPSLPRRHGLAVPWLLVGGYTAAVLDLSVAVAYWAPHGVAPSRIPQSIAAWVLGPAAFSGGTLTAVFGALLYGQLLWGVASLYHAIARRHPLLLKRPLACGALYGIAAYASIFQLLVPLLCGVRPVVAPYWTATCLLAYATVVGMPCALFSRAAGRAATHQA